VNQDTIGGLDMEEESSPNRRDLMRMLAGLGVAMGAGEVLAQDAAKVDPRGYKVRVDNDQVRVLEYIGKPRLGVCGQGMHSHPDHVTVVLTPGKVKVTLPDGKSFVEEGKPGDVFFEPAGTHSVENIGTRETRSLLIEIKKKA
jgi:quercetin dioxygenase-like cupin family protein